MRDEYINSRVPGGITKDNRKLLDILNRQRRGPFKITDASKVLGISHPKATRLLAYWASRGWLARVQKGLYITVPLGTTIPAERKEDPWIVATQIFEPCYIGGLSACEHWGLTEQIFKDIVIFTSYKARKRKIQIQNTTYIVKVVQKEKLFGTKIVWREQTRAKVSDPSRTIVDILDDPSIGGGMQHISDVIRQYFKGEHRDDTKLLEFMERVNNRTIYKRLGYVIETLVLGLPDILEVCKSKISKGYSAFDPSVSARGHFVRRWNLRVNVTIEPKDKT